MKITILCDDQKSWFIPYGQKLQDTLAELGHDVRYVHDKGRICAGDVCFLLSCCKLVDVESLGKNKHNIVIHASDLPQGKGFSPVQWQVLEGKNRIVLTLFEAVPAVDAGPYYFKDAIDLDGTELYDEIRHKLGMKIIEMAVRYVNNWSMLRATDQMGEETYYRRRTEEDDQLDPNKTILEQFDHLRIADNERHPVWFCVRGRKYVLKIYAIHDDI